MQDAAEESSDEEDPGAIGTLGFRKRAPRALKGDGKDVVHGEARASSPQRREAADSESDEEEAWQLAQNRTSAQRATSMMADDELACVFSCARFHKASRAHPTAPHAFLNTAGFTPQ